MATNDSEEKCEVSIDSAHRKLKFGQIYMTNIQHFFARTWTNPMNDTLSLCGLCVLVWLCGG